MLVAPSTYEYHTSTTTIRAQCSRSILPTHFTALKPNCLLKRGLSHYKHECMVITPPTLFCLLQVLQEEGEHFGSIQSQQHDIESTHIPTPPLQHRLGIRVQVEWLQPDIQVVGTLPMACLGGSDGSWGYGASAPGHAPSLHQNRGRHHTGWPLPRALQGARRCALWRDQEGEGHPSNGGHALCVGPD